MKFPRTNQEVRGVVGAGMEAWKEVMAACKLTAPVSAGKGSSTPIFVALHPNPYLHHVLAIQNI